MNRRSFVLKSSAGFAGLAGFGFAGLSAAAALHPAPELKITAIETVRFKNAHWMWLRLHTSEGITGTMFDLTWCGGLSEGKKIADMANTWYIPSMLHTAGGPVLWAASTHLAAALSNLFFVESVWPFWHDRDFAYFENPPQVKGGLVSPSQLPGLGLQFKKGLFEQDDVIIEKIA